MRVETLVPDLAPMPRSNPEPMGGFGKMVDDIASVLDGAQRAEDSFAAGSGDLQSAVYQRARADVALSVATAAAQRAASALQSVLNMQV